MERVYQVRSFPDLSLPKYYDLFGDQALEVVATRVFGWLQLSLTERFGSTLRLRYLYDGSATAHDRLKLFILIRTSDSTDAEESVRMGQQLMGDVIELEPCDKSLAVIPGEISDLAILKRLGAVVEENAAAVHYVPMPWDRGSAARAANEPYLDEAFATTVGTAFLDICLEVVDSQAIRRALNAAIENLSYRESGDKGSGLSDALKCYKAHKEALATDPVCRVTVVGGSSVPGAAISLLRRFGLDSIGGSSFRVHSMSSSANWEEPLSWQEPGWFDHALRAWVADHESSLTTNQKDVLREMSELSVLVGPQVIKDLLTLPIPRRGYLRTFPLETERPSSHQTLLPQSKPGEIVLGESIERGMPISIPSSHLTRHVFVSGVTGSGKSVTMLNLLRQLGEQRIPFLVLEPAKSEYRRLLGIAEFAAALRVYTPGKDLISPLRINPFAVSHGVALATHVAGLSASLRCALNLPESVAILLESTVWDLYAECGWLEDDIGSEHRRIPRVADLLPAALRAIDNVGYDPEVTSRFKGLLRARFQRVSRGSIGRLFDCQESHPATPDWLAQSSIVELGALAQAEANLLTMFLLTSIREELVRAGSTTDSHAAPRLVIVLEEAHNLVPAVPEDATPSEEGSAKIESSRYISNMLAEMRALGLAIIVVDQTPSAVSAQVIRSTNLKIAHRSVAKADRETLADSMLMQPTHSEMLGRLQPGQAYVYADKFFRPHYIQCPMLIIDSSSATSHQVDFDLAGLPPEDVALYLRMAATHWYKTDLLARQKEILRRIVEIRERASSLSSSVQEVYAANAVHVLEERLPDWRESHADLERAISGLRVEYRAISRGMEHLDLVLEGEEDIEKLERSTAVLSQILGHLNREFGVA